AALNFQIFGPLGGFCICPNRRAPKAVLERPRTSAIAVGASLAPFCRCPLGEYPPFPELPSNLKSGSCSSSSSRLQNGHFRIEKSCNGAFNRSASRVQADDTAAHEWCQCRLEVVPTNNEFAQPGVRVEERRRTAKHNVCELTAFRVNRIDTGVACHEFVSFEARLTSG